MKVRKKKSTFLTFILLILGIFIGSAIIETKRSHVALEEALNLWQEDLALALWEDNWPLAHKIAKSLSPTNFSSMTVIAKNKTIYSFPSNLAYNKTCWMPFQKGLFRYGEEFGTIATCHSPILLAKQTLTTPAFLMGSMLLCLIGIVFVRVSIRRKFEIEHANIQLDIAKQFNTLAAQVAHDIRSPLAALNSLIEDLHAIPEDKRILAQHSIKRIHDIANDLLKHKKEMKPQTQAKNPQPQPQEPNEDPKEILSHETDIHKLIETIAAEKRLQYKTRQTLRIDTSLSRAAIAEKITTTKIDQNSLSRILSNLINNAVEAMPEDNDNPLITLELTAENNHARITITDNGKGIPLEVLKNLGHEGFSHDKKEGSGLGLFHAKSTVESWGGGFSIESKKNQGTTVAISIPVTIPAAIPVESANGKKSVLVEDDILIRTIWKNKAKQKSIDIDIFKNAQSLLDVIVPYGTDTVFYIDSSLPDIKGEELSKKLYDLGFRNLYLQTGHDPDDFKDMAWIKAVLGKSPPY